MIVKSEYGKIEAYRTKDGSQIREMMHPDVHGNSLQSLAEAMVPVGAATRFHRHRESEEIYHILEGRGLMDLEDRQVEVLPRDTLCIPPGTPHRIRNTGPVPLKFLCCCSPAYSHGDTDLLT
jgi:mannose-6-phosphate isomerase-like protein (cupin superfamily)